MQEAKRSMDLPVKSVPDYYVVCSHHVTAIQPHTDRKLAGLRLAFIWPGWLRYLHSHILLCWVSPRRVQGCMYETSLYTALLQHDWLIAWIHCCTKVCNKAYSVFASYIFLKNCRQIRVNCVDSVLKKHSLLKDNCGFYFPKQAEWESSGLSLWS